MNISLTFPGEPRAVQSVRFAKVGKFMRKYQPKEVTEWKNWIRIQARQQYTGELFDSAIFINASFFFGMPKSWPKYKIRNVHLGHKYYKTTKPDLTDNLMKGLIDALTEIVWTDDSIICKVQSEKCYSINPRIELIVEKIEEDEV